MKLMIRAHDLLVKGEKDIVKNLCELELDGIQLVAYKSIDGVTYSEGSLTCERAKQISETLTDKGKEIALIGAYFNPVHPNAQKAEHGAVMFREYLSLSESLGCSFVGSETGSFMGDPWGYHPSNRTDEARKKVVDVFRSFADYATRYGASVAIEGAFNHVCYSPDVLSDVLCEIKRNNVRVIFDLYNYLDISNYTDAYTILSRGHELFGKDILIYHIKDFTVTDGKLKQCAVGKGILDYERILAEIYGYNKDATLVLEGTVGEDIADSVKYLRKIISNISKD